MVKKFFFKNLNLSFKKLNFFLRNILNISNFFFEIFIYLNYFYNKTSFILKKIFLYIINSFNLEFIFNLKVKNILPLKGKIFKKYNYRAKGSFDFILKKYCNIFLILHS